LRERDFFLFSKRISNYNRKHSQFKFKIFSTEKMFHWVHHLLFSQLIFFKQQAKQHIFIK